MTFTYNSPEGIEPTFKVNKENDNFVFEFDDVKYQQNDFTIPVDDIYHERIQPDINDEQQNALNTFKEYTNFVYPIKDSNIRVSFLDGGTSERFDHEAKANFQRWLKPLAKELNKENAVIVIRVKDCVNNYSFENISPELLQKALAEMTKYRIP